MSLATAKKAIDSWNNMVVLQYSIISDHCQTVVIAAGISDQERQGHPSFIAVLLRMVVMEYIDPSEARHDSRKQVSHVVKQLYTTTDFIWRSVRPKRLV